MHFQAYFRGELFPSTPDSIQCRPPAHLHLPVLVRCGNISAFATFALRTFLLFFLTAPTIAFAPTHSALLRLRLFIALVGCSDLTVAAPALCFRSRAPCRRAAPPTARAPPTAASPTAPAAASLTAPVASPTAPAAAPVISCPRTTWWCEAGVGGPVAPTASR